MELTEKTEKIKKTAKTSHQPKAAKTGKRARPRLDSLSLSDEFNNLYSVALINTLNALRGETMNEAAFLGSITRLTEDKGNDFYDYNDQLKDKKTQSSILNLVVNKSDKAHWRLEKERCEIPMCLSLTERVYLKSILRSRYSAIFFDDDEKERLLERFADVPDIGLEKNSVFAKNDENMRQFGQDEISKIRALLSAVRYQREIQYSNHANNGVDYKGCKGFPVRIEYSVFDDRFRLSLWSGGNHNSNEEGRPIKINISSMYDISETGRKWEAPLTPQEMMITRLSPDPIEMRLKGENYIFERALYSFSMYDTNIERTGEIEYSFRLRYYQFDLPEIIDRIMSFGPAIQVLSPLEAIERIKRRLSDTGLIR